VDISTSRESRLHFFLIYSRRGYIESQYFVSTSSSTAGIVYSVGHMQVPMFLTFLRLCFALGVQCEMATLNGSQMVTFAVPCSRSWAQTYPQHTYHVPLRSVGFRI